MTKKDKFWLCTLAYFIVNTIITFCHRDAAYALWCSGGRNEFKDTLDRLEKE